MIDLHSHILPGLDDGAQTEEDALEMAKIAEEDGIRKIVATPHLFRGDFTPKDFRIIEKRRQEFILSLDKNGINIDTFVGAEVHIAHNLINEIGKSRNHLVINQGSYMLVEFPSDHVFSGVKSLFFNLMSEGIIPIITHPERNSVFVRNPSLLYELIKMGAFSQANSGSFMGLYGLKAQAASNTFLEHGFIHFIASDCHNMNSLSPKLSDAVSKVASIIGKKNAIALVRDNPQAVIDNQDLPFNPLPKNPEEGKKSWSIKIPNLFR